jgi:phosphatidylserine/phosphatidylglycerophosphate/cardiolipin synthase-like enzyme
MPTTDELKTKWFLTFGAGPGFPPVARHEGSAVGASTDGNLVTRLIDGKEYMKVWRDAIAALTVAQTGELYHAGWRFEGVRTLGHSVPASNALDLMKAAVVAGVAVFPMICRNPMTLAFNSATVAWLIANGVTNARLDNRFPLTGSNHQKFAVFKSAAEQFGMLGSIDISKTRWDDDAHASSTPTVPHPDRDPTFGKPTHDTGVKVNGPAVADIENTFRERWNDSSRDGSIIPPKAPGLFPPPVPPLITTPVSSPGVAGTTAVQALHTYGRTTAYFGYSWSPVGEFTVWAAYLKAIQTAATYIYIEDQYFLPFGYQEVGTPPVGHAFCTSPAATPGERNTDIVFQLGEAIKRGVRVAVLVPSNAEDSTHVYQKHQRDLGYHYLTGVAAGLPAGATGKFVMATLHNGTEAIYVHSKLMICDDEYLAIGSTNVGQRSMTFDSELHIGAVDGVSTIVKDFRKALWAEHMTVPPAGLDNPTTAYTAFVTSTNSAPPTGRLRPYVADPPGTAAPWGHKFMIDKIDPYGGPPR